ncbi:ABC transporter permease [Lampropedia cohaerens]|uniref:ABC transporter permease n=1 Tax=Lampropedia cohaerens TaxID=1610491 RepID=A0A0U1Q2B8_9BURK|nr:iron ABC transporter permease [Lampropedia cohaerens]KKW68892.1 ABC transporter permease [Lampropedia cohaerens]
MTTPLPQSEADTDAPRHAQRGVWLLAALALLAALLLAMGLATGSEGFAPLQAMRDDPVMRQIVMDVRLPRTLGALLAGALLGLAGCVAQGLFRNPLADPYLLGSASGAALGVTLALLGLVQAAGEGGAGGVLVHALAMHAGLTGAAFLGALAAVMVTLLLARGALASLQLLLAGVITGVVLGALRDLILQARPALLQAMQSYALGSTAFVSWQGCAIMALTLLVCVLVAWALARGLDGLSLGADTARSLGLPLGAVQAALVVVLALATGAAVAQCGLLAFVGLAAPHLVRALVMVRHRQLLVLSTAMGAVLLASADWLARWLIAPQELPVSVLTALLGGSYLLGLMLRRRRRSVEGMR